VENEYALVCPLSNSRDGLFAFERTRPGVAAVVTLEMIDDFLRFNPNHFFTSAINLNAEGFSLALDDNAGTAAFAIGTAAQLPVNDTEQNIASDHPKNAKYGKDNQKGQGIVEQVV
jgi:hypothetical protein